VTGLGGGTGSGGLSVTDALALVRAAGVPSGAPFHLVIPGLDGAQVDRVELGRFLERVATLRGAPVYLSDPSGTLVERYVPRPGVTLLAGLPDRRFRVDPRTGARYPVRSGHPGSEGLGAAWSGAGSPHEGAPREIRLASGQTLQMGV